TYGNLILRCLAGEARRGRIDLVALADTDAAARDRAAARFGLPGHASAGAMIAAHALDAVAIATPDHLHTAPIELALAHGLHVMTEKPLDVRLDRATRLADAFVAAGLVLYVDLH